MALVLVLSALSGAAGLVYEVLWAKRLALLFGSAAWAQALTLAGFLGGLALGGALLGRRADAASSARRFFARVELVVAALGLLAPLVLLIPIANKPLALLLLLAQAFAMGGAVPALCRCAGGEAQKGIGALYGINALGAVAGCLLAPFVLIPAAGLSWAFLAAAALNLAAAAGAALWTRDAPMARAKADAASAPETGYALLAVFLSGAASLLLESAWTRLLALVIGSSSYSFAEMLAGFIFGIAAGGLLAAWGPVRRRDPGLMLGCALSGAAFATLLILPLCDDLPFAFIAMRVVFPTGTAGFYLFEAAKLAFCAALMLLPAVGLGLALPLAARLRERDPSGRGAAVGGALAANAFGNVVGALAAVLLLPALGLEGTTRAAATLLALAGAAAFWGQAGRPGLAVAVLAVAAAWRVALPPWDLIMLTQGGFRVRFGDARPSERARELSQQRMRLLFHRDDREASVTVQHYVETGMLSLRVNGKADASTGGDMRTQVLLGHMPLMLRPGTRSALTVGLGSAVTAGALLSHGGQVDAVELVPAVVAGARLFSEHNGGALQNPRLRLHVEDAKTFLARPGPKYGVIVSEPSNPWMAGVSDLFSKEYYERAAARLEPDGVMAQWFQLYEMDDGAFRLALRTFLGSFPHTTAWIMANTDLLLVGSRQPLEPDFAALEAAFRDPAVWRDLSRAGVNTPAALLARQRAGEQTVRELAGFGPVNTELRPRLDRAAQKAFFNGSWVSLFKGPGDDRGSKARRPGLLLERYLKSRGRGLEPIEYKDILGTEFAPEDFTEKERVIREWSKRFPKDKDAAAAMRGAGLKW